MVCFTFPSVTFNLNELTNCPDTLNNLPSTTSPVTPVFLHGDYDIAAVTKLVRDLRENMGIFCSIVVYPVVPKGQIMLRIIPTSSHTLADIEYTCDCFAEVQKRLKSGYYAQ